MDFESAVQYLKQFSPYEDKGGSIYDDKKFDLERVRKFYKAFGIDYEKLNYIHVAGSKGKGTTCLFLANYLSKLGYKVGMFTSPYLLDITESFWINGICISKKEFVEYVVKVKSFLDKNGNKYNVTYFEILTGIVIQYFIKNKVKYAVMEVGLGGRLDATNVIFPKVTVLTSIEKEHTRILGKTLSKILNEKLGIVKSGVPLVVGKNSQYVREMIKNKIGRKTEFIFIENLSFEEKFRFSKLNIPYVQKENAKTAYVSLRQLIPEIDLNDFCDFVEKVKLEGRYDLRKISGKNVVFDFAHTKNSISELVQYLPVKFTNKKFVFLVSLMKDKDVKGILRKIFQCADRIVFTESNMDRGFSSLELAKISRKLNSSFIIKTNKSPIDAYKSAIKSLKNDEILVVTGSHFLVGNILKD